MRSGQETTIQISPLVLAAKVWGAEEGVRTLALHGWLDNAASFDLLAPNLGGFHIVAVDLPGHGLSSHRPMGASYHLTDWVWDIASIADSLGWDRFSLVGHSMGAGIGSLFAGTFPERVERLVLIEGLGTPICEPAEAPTRLAEGIKRLQMLKERELPKHKTMETMVSRLRQATPGLSEQAAQLLVARGSRAVDGGFVWRSDPRLRVPSFERLSRPQLYAFLDKISCPTLVIRAVQGFPFDPEEGRSQLARIRDARLVEMDGGHHVHMDAPEKVAEVMELFFASTRA